MELSSSVSIVPNVKSISELRLCAKKHSEQFINAMLAVVLLLNKFKNSLIMNKNILKEIASMLFELQYEKNGLYGYDISFRMVTDNKSFRVTVFHHGNRDFYMDMKTIDDVNKLNDKIWN